MKVTEFMDLMDRADGLSVKMGKIIDDFTFIDFMRYYVVYERYTGPDPAGYPWEEQELVPLYYMSVFVKLLEEAARVMESDKESDQKEKNSYLRLVKG